MDLSVAWTLFSQFASLAMVAFGGASALLPELHRVVVEQQQWMDSATFTQLFAIAQAAPGPNLLVVTLIGWQVAGVPGALLTTFAFTLPMSVAVFVLIGYWDRFRGVRWQRALQLAVAPLAVGLVASSAWLIAATGTGEGHRHGWLLVLLAILLNLRTQLHPLWLIGLGALVGGLGWL